jgi:hypothetical protein
MLDGDWSSDVCSSDLGVPEGVELARVEPDEALVTPQPPAPHH